MAVRTVSNAGGNWNATTTWVGGIVPIAGDTIDFTATSGNITVNVSTANLIGINFTNYVGAITFTNNINVNTSVNLGTGGYTQSGTNGLVINGNTTISSNGVTWGGTLNIASNGTYTITLDSDLKVVTFIIGGSITINGAFNIYCAYFNINNLSSGQVSAILTFSGIVYCSNDATFSLATSSCRITGDLYVGGSCYHNAPASSTQGAANLYMVGNGELRPPSTLGTFTSNLYFNTSGKITITGNVSYQFGAARTINLIRGNVEARKATLTLNRAFTHTLTNMNKIVWGNVILDTVSAIGLNMNEFFCGDATTQTNITTNNAAINATVTFTDNFEKIAKFVNINGVTFTRPQQLLLLTNQPKKSRNIGIRYNNQSPNGIAKNDPSVQNQMAYSVGSYLVGDPNM